MSRRRHSRTLLGLLAAAVTGVSGAVAVAPTSALADPSPAIAPALPPGGSFVPVPPTRVLDTRQVGGRVSTTTFDPSAALVGVDPKTVADVLVNVTVVDATAPGYATVGTANASSNGDFVAGTPSATLALVRWYPGQAEPVSVSARAHVVVDVQGYVTKEVAATSASFTPLAAPVRVADSRTPTGLHPFGAGETQTVDVRSGADLPTDATAVIANLTVASATAGTFVTGWSGSGTRPTVSSVNAGPGDIVANRALLPLDADGRVALYNLAGRTDLVVDIVGYLSPDPAGSFYQEADYPTRLLDTTGTTVTVQPTITSGAGAGLAPAADDLEPTTAVWLTVAGDQPAGPGYVATRPGGSPVPGTSDLDLVPFRAVANAGPVRVSAVDGTVTVAASVPTRLVVDLAGWFRKRAGAAAAGFWTASGPVGVPRWTRPTDLPMSFVHGLYQGDGDSTTAYAIAPDGALQSSDALTINGLLEAAPWSSPYTWLQPPRVLAVAGEPEEDYTQLLMVDAAGTLLWEGPNSSGEAGTAPDPKYHDLTQVPLPGNVVRVFAEYGIGYAVLTDGTLWSWGRADSGQLGRSATASPWVPAQVTGLAGAPTAMAGDGLRTYAIDPAGHTTWWGTVPDPAAPTTAVVQATPTPDAAACAVGASLHGDEDGVYELCADGSVVQLSDDTRRLDVTLPVVGVTAIAANAGDGTGVRALLADGRVADVTATSARYEAGFQHVIAINGSRNVQVTLVGS